MTTIWEETLGELKEVPCWADYLGEEGEEKSLSEALGGGSYRGWLRAEEGGGTDKTIPDFALAPYAQSSAITGKGEDEQGVFAIAGRSNHTKDGPVRIAYTKLYEGVERDSPIHGRFEIRCESRESVMDQNGVDVGPGFVGLLYTLEGRDLDLRVFEMCLYPTPLAERVGGIEEVVFEGPLCGLEHTGTFVTWIGAVSEVRRVLEPAGSLGVKPADHILALNGKPLPAQKKSLDISKLIKNSQRPLRMTLWREVSQVQVSILPLNSLSAVSEDGPMETPTSAVSMDRSFRSIEHTSADLKKNMMGEILKKRQSLDKMRKDRSDPAAMLERRNSFMQS